MIDVAIQKVRRAVLPGARTDGASGARGADRTRRAVLTGGVATIARIVQISTSLVTVPLTLKYLGNERFGLWMTISSVLAMAAFADFGVGNGVLNAVATAHGKDDTEGVRRAVSSGFAILTSIAALLLFLFFLIYPTIGWADFFRAVSPQARAEAGPALAVFAVCFAINISIDVVQRVQLGLQQGYRYGLWQLSGSIIGLIGVLAGIWLRFSLPVLVVAIAGAPVLATVLNSIHFFGFVRPDLRPSYRFVSRDAIVKIVKLGVLFFVLQLAVSVSYSSDNVILTRILGPLAVAQYAVPAKLFGMIAIVTSFITTPLWPAYGEALARKDHLWIRKTLYRSLVLVLGVTTLLSVITIVFAKTIIHIWVGPSINPPWMLISALGISSVFCAVASTVGVFLNGLSVVRFQVILAILGSTANVLLSIYLTRRIGISGVVFGTILTQVFIGFMPYYIFVRNYLKLLCPARP